MSWVTTLMYCWWSCNPYECVLLQQRNNFTVVSETNSGIYNNRTEQLPAHNVMLSGYLQSWRYFVHIEDQLRHDFMFHLGVNSGARRILDSHVPPSWRNTSFARVVIHVRRGDYLNRVYVKRGWKRPERNYFNRSMSYFNDCLPRVQFIVISDDMPWCRENIVGSNVVFLEDAKTPVDALAVASQCDHAIISIGSFGWWAAWLANGVTIAQGNFPSGELVKSFRCNDYYKPDWITFWRVRFYCSRWRMLQRSKGRPVFKDTFHEISRAALVNYAQPLCC